MSCESCLKSRQDGKWGYRSRCTSNSTDNGDCATELGPKITWPGRGAANGAGGSSNRVMVMISPLRMMRWSNNEALFPEICSASVDLRFDTPVLQPQKQPQIWDQAWGHVPGPGTQRWTETPGNARIQLNRQLGCQHAAPGCARQRGQARPLRRTSLSYRHWEAKREGTSFTDLPRGLRDRERAQQRRACRCETDAGPGRRVEVPSRGPAIDHVAAEPCVQRL